MTFYIIFYIFYCEYCLLAFHWHYTESLVVAAVVVTDCELQKMKRLKAKETIMDLVCTVTKWLLLG